MTQNTDFAALIGSRICHDLISPIGAINNGIELIEMSGAQSTSPEMALISESVRSASARIRYFRLAFGAAGEQMVGRPEVLSILADVYGPSRISLDWRIEEVLPRGRVRMCFLALMCLESALPYGGQIVIDAQGDALQLTGTGDKVNLVPDLWEVLSGRAPQTPLLPGQVQFGLLPLLAADAGRHISVTGDEATVTLTV